MRFYKSIIFGSLLLAGCAISSCDNEEDYQNATPEINISGEERIVTFEVDDAFTGNDETVTRSTLDEEQTVYKDLDFEAVIERDEPVKTRAEQQPLEQLNNIAVTVIIYNSQSGKVTAIQQARVNKGQLSIKLPDGNAATAVLYSYRTEDHPFVPYNVGDNIDNNKNTPEEARDLLYASVSIPAGSATIPKVSLRHLFAKIKVTVATAAPTMQSIASFSGELTIPHNIGRVYLNDGHVVAGGDQQVYTIKHNTNTVVGPERSSVEIDIIPFSGEVLTFKLNTGVPTSGIPWMDYNIPFKDSTIKSGYRYTIKITLYPPTIQYYEWDADDAYFKGNNTKYRGGANAYASSSCQWAAPDRYFPYAFNSYTYKSFGYPYRAYPSGTTVEAVKNGTAKLAIYNTGFWVRKASEWQVASPTGKGQVATTNEMYPEGGKRQFIPAAGYILSEKFQAVGEEAYYWSQDSSDGETSMIMYITASEAGSKAMRRDMAAPVIRKDFLDPGNNHP